MTFRILEEWQTGAWIVPGRVGLHIAQTVADGLRPLAETIFAGAARADSAV